MGEDELLQALHDERHERVTAAYERGRLAGIAEGRLLEREAVAKKLRAAMEKGAQMETDNKLVKATLMLVGVDAVLQELEGTAPSKEGRRT